MQKISSLVAVVLVVLCQIILMGSSAQATDVIRNGTFDAGMNQWNINPALPTTWDPLLSGRVKLHPPSSGFTGDIIYQNLNVTGIADKTFSFSCDLSALYAPSGSTIAVYADYLNSGVVTTTRLANPLNSTITTATPVTGTFTFPSTAERLIKIRVAKENYGEFTIDNVSFSADGISIANVPAISSLSATSGAYGSLITVNGSDFGVSTGSVTIAGSASGVAINSWSNSAVTITVSDPVRSGAVILKTGDKVESNADKLFTVTSPNYIIELIAQKVQVVKGQSAEFVINSTFLNGFTSTNGVTFSVSGMPTGGTSSFAPVPLMRSGGVVLKVNTAAISAGSYDLSIQASSTGTAARTVTGKLVVTTTATLDFKRLDPVTYQQSTVTSPLAITGQGNLNLSLSATDSSGLPFSDIQLSSSNPSVVGVYKNTYGYDVYVHNGGTADLTATAPDGTSGTLKVNADVPSTSRVDISLLPQTITNKYTDFIQLNSTYTFGVDQWYSSSTPQAITMLESSLGFGLSSPPYYYGGQFKIDHSKTSLGSYIFSGSILNGVPNYYTGYIPPELYKNILPLVITNDPSYAGLNVTIKSLDSALTPHNYEYFDIEFYNSADGTLAFTLGNRTFTMGDKFYIGAIAPGSYKLKLVPTSTDVMAHWYTNATGFSEAQAVTFTAGSANDLSLYFFAQFAPDTTPPDLNTFTANGNNPATSTSLTVTNISVYAYDVRGVTGYCLTETNDPATCTSWSANPPTSYTFSSAGNKTLYAFAKDAAGNISITTTTSTLAITVNVTYALTLNITGTGHGTETGTDMACGASCSPKDFGGGVSVTLIAAPDADSFAGWTGCTSVSQDGNTCTVVMSSPKTVTLTFTTIPPVRIARTGTKYDTVMGELGAYKAAVTGDYLQIRKVLVSLGEILVFDRDNISITLDGGKENDYITTSGDTVFSGSMSIKSGKVSAKGIKVK